MSTAEEEQWWGKHQQGSHGRQESLCAYRAVPLRTWMVLLRVPPRATLAIVEVPVVYAAHKAALLPLLYATN